MHDMMKGGGGGGRRGKREGEEGRGRERRVVGAGKTRLLVTSSTSCAPYLTQNFNGSRKLLFTNLLIFLFLCCSLRSNVRSQTSPLSNTHTTEKCIINNPRHHVCSAVSNNVPPCISLLYTHFICTVQYCTVRST